MASTNKTANYNLSQYVGTDKPTYLGDYNADMNKIDAQMKVNGDGISANAAQIEIVRASATSASQNADEAKATAESAESTGQSALSKATINESTIANLEGDVKFGIGDTYSRLRSSGDLITSIGYITNSTRDLVFNIETDKSMINVKPVVTELLILGRGVSGYTDNRDEYFNPMTTPGFTVTYRKDDNFHIGFTVAKNSAYANSTNNTPVAVATYVTIRFEEE